MKLYRINNETVCAEFENGDKYEVPWKDTIAVTLKGKGSLEKFVQMAGHQVYNNTGE